MARSKSSTTSSLLGSVLVTGGCGFLGTHLVQTLLDDPSCAQVFVLDRAPPSFALAGVTYIQGSITDPKLVATTLALSRPTTIFHAASPNFTFPPLHKKDFFDTNVGGTQLLIDEAKKARVKAFVFTSTVDGYAGHPHRNVDEAHPLWTVTTAPKEGQYALSKAIADDLVLKSSTADFGTTCLRVAHLYGDGDTHAIPAALDACAGSKPLFQLGEGKNLMECVSLENCSTAHVLAAKALLDPSLAKGKVNGEAFNLSDGAAIPFWRFFEIIWGEARGRDVKKEMWIFPNWLVHFLVTATEWLFFIFTLGLKTPKGVDQMERNIIEYCLESHSYNVSKIKERLGFQPKGDWEQVLRKAVRWEMVKRGIGAKEKDF